jgi:hypothetical protein
MLGEICKLCQRLEHLRVCLLLRLAWLHLTVPWMITLAIINFLCGSDIRSSNRPAVKSESYHWAVY